MSSGAYCIFDTCQPITRQHTLDFSKLKEFADDNLKFDENGSKLSKWVENIVGKGQIACYEQFLLFPQCFQIACFPGASKGVIVWEWVKTFKNYQPMNFQRTNFLCSYLYSPQVGLTKKIIDSNEPFG